MRKIQAAILFFTFFFTSASAQLLQDKPAFNRGDTLRGTLSKLRSCYDVSYYHLDFRVDIPNKSIKGSNRIRFRVMEDFTRLQADLFSNLAIDSIVFEGQNLPFEREYNAVFITFPRKMAKGSWGDMKIWYGGRPTIAKQAPWDGGFVWQTDSAGKPWIGLACEGLGASMWWPNKDHLSDEPDSMLISGTVPSGLMYVANGRLRAKTELADGFTRYDWFVASPINNYNVSLNIGDYVVFSDTHVRQDTLTLDYYVLRENLEKARRQFTEVKPMLQCLERYFGPYPFYEDGYKLIDAPYLGMEHQSAIAYGNEYQTGYKGTDFSGIGLTFDYIIIHESGHEWWGNSVTARDIADMWIHEGFCSYSDALYVECLFDYATSVRYLNHQKTKIANDKPVLGVYNMNNEGSGDMYYKGALLLHTLRHVIDNDKLWFEILLGIATDFRHKATSTPEIVAYFNKKTGTDYTYFFDQYLRFANPPTLDLQLAQKGPDLEVTYRWISDVKDFRMPVKVSTAKGKMEFIEPLTSPRKKLIKKMKKEDFKVAEELGYYRIKTS